MEINDEVIEKVKDETNVSYVKILQHYLLSPEGIEKRIRKREKDGNTIFYYSEATQLTPNTRIKGTEYYLKDNIMNMHLKLIMNLIL